MVEIKAGEGGLDAKAFVHELASIYVRYASLKNLTVSLVDTAPGSATLEISGKGALLVFESESGKHVVQRCPPSERGGRRHTSMVSVGVLPVFSFTGTPILDKDIEIIFQNASGPGGQGVNTCKSACRMKHIPTGIYVKSQVHRSPQQNRSHAYQLLCGRVQEQKFAEQNNEYAVRRKLMLGDTGRGGARRTYNLYKNFIADHLTGKRTNDVKSVMKGNLDLLVDSKEMAETESVSFEAVLEIANKDQVLSLYLLGEEVSFDVLGLFEKGGFCDGDLFGDFIWNYLQLTGIDHKEIRAKNKDFRASEVLFRIMNNLVLPRITSHIVEIDRVVTCHNSVRAIRIDGRIVEPGEKIDFQPENIYVPLQEIIEEIDDMINAK